MKKQFFAVLAAALVLSTSAFAAGFARTNTYTDGQFKDVKTGVWYAKEVQSAYELGFMKGTGEDVFSPDGNVTVAQGITMAARVNASYNSKAEIAVSGANWYDAYVDYAKSNGIITENQFDDYNRNITRAEMAVLFANAVPKSEFAAKNTLEHIPDVVESESYADELLMLYKAGVVMGSDAYGTFNPDADIKRSEAAAIINRVAIPENRLSKTLKEYTARDAYQLIHNGDSYMNKVVQGKPNAIHESLPSGWILDNRGGTPRLDIEKEIKILQDVSTKDGVALIREVNNTEGEHLVADFECLAGGDGAFVAFSDKDTKSVYEIKVVNGLWCVLKEDGSYNPLVEAAKKGKDDFRVILDQNTKKATTIINGTNYGESGLLSDNILSFRFATDEKSTVTMLPGKINVVANYGVYENFEFNRFSEVYGWNSTNATVNDSQELVLSGKASAKTSFDAIDVKYISEILSIFPEGETAGYRILAGDKSAIELKSENGKLYANGVVVYEKLTKNMWYRLRVEANPSAGKADIVVNGRTMATVALNTTNPVDTLEIFSENGNAKFDNITLYNNVDHYDYVARPEIKADFSDYIVGMNVCSLWKNNAGHFGWACITPYDENRPVLGYYDEGNPETADWEIKYMVEHGIDVQAFCWYNDSAEGPVKEPRNRFQLHDAYQHAKYEDYMKYCLIWELAATPSNSEKFREHIVPYWFENYFLDENYFTLDNKIVIDMFGANALAGKSYFGSAENVAKEFEYINEVARSYGFDGVIFIANDDVQLLENLGIGARAAYHWDSIGYQLEAEKNMNSAANKISDAVYQIPTISVGFNDVAWMGGRKPLMTVSDYDKAFEWVKNEYIPENAEKGTWQEKLVWLSTWNEYGEGTYISPSGLNGFGYLDVLRKHFTKLDGEHEDALPTDAQSARITREYPQYARALRREQKLPGDNMFEVEYEVVHRFDFDESNSATSGCDNVTYSENGLTATSNRIDFQAFLSGISYGVDIDDISTVRIYMQTPAGSKVEVFYCTAANPSEAQSRSLATVAPTSDMNAYDFNFESQAYWKGKLTKLRIDPANANGTTFTIKAVELLKNKTAAEREALEANSGTLYVNGMEINSAVPSEKKGDEILFPFDADTSIQNIMHVFHTWRKDEGTLKLETNNHVAVFTVGSDKYIADGTEKNLGYTLYTSDGLPMLSFKALSDALGFTYKAEGDKVYVDTPYKYVYDSMLNRKEGAWEFNGYDSEDWVTATADFFFNGEYLKLDNAEKDDVNMNMENHSAKFPAAKYPTLEIRMRHKYEKEGDPSNIAIYFITDVDKKWNEAKAIRTKTHESKDTNGEWVTYTIDMASLKTWTSKIEAVRIDPYDAIGYAEIDYIRFIEDPEYVRLEQLKAQEGIVNGDAEEPSINTFTSGNSQISIVEDPTNKNNHAYLVTGAQKKSWSYFVHDYPLEKGQYYKISADFMAVSDSDGNKVPLSIACNIQYNEIGAKDGNAHVISVTKVPNDGKWVHYEKEFVVNDMLNKDVMAVSFYADPPSETTSGTYLVDNVKVEKIEGKVVEEKKPLNASNLKTLYTLKYDDANSFAVTNINDVKFDGKISGVTATSDPTILNKGNLKANLDDVVALKINAKVPANTTMEIFFCTDEHNQFSESKKFNLVTKASSMTSHILDVSKNEFWKGTLLSLRIDPSVMPNTPFEIVSVEFCTEGEGGANTGSTEIKADIKKPVETSNLKTVHTLTYDKADKFGVTNINDLKFDGKISGVTATGDPTITSKGNLGVDIDKVVAIKINAKIPTGSTAEIFFATEDQPNLSESKKFNLVSKSSEMTSHIVEVQNNENWAGTLKTLRIDPSVMANTAFEIVSVEFCTAE